MDRSVNRPLRGRAAACLLVAGILPAAAGANEPATWKEQDLQLDYMGFTTRFSCDGLRDRVRTVLLRLGARPDLEVVASGCARLSGPDRFPSVHAHFVTLQPAAAPAPESGTWKSLNLGGGQGLQPGECELAEAVLHTVLPHFAVRNVGPLTRCVPHENPIAVSLPLEVFAPATPPPAGAAAP